MDTLSIKAKTPTNDILDFDYLKQLAIDRLQKLTGKIWTDYNLHDPGITILEVLAFALTELGYRSRYPVQDLLTTKNRQPKDTLFAPSDILPTRPVTLKDYHKIILDIEGVKDVIIYPTYRYPEFKGIYDINIELFPDFDDPINRNIITNEIFLELQSNRNLCEDFNKVKFIEHEPVTFEIDIDVNDQQDISMICIDIYSELIKYLSPSVNFYSLQDLIDKGLKIDEIFEGPLLKSGFVLDSDFARIEDRNKIFASDVIHFVMDVKGVNLIKKLNIIDSKGEKHKWFCSIEKGKAFKLDLEKTKIRCFKVGNLVELKEDLSKEINKISEARDNRMTFKRLTFVREEGVFRNLKKYYTIQNDFPNIYGIGETGLANSVSPQRKAQAKQLKTYLMFFEQILANFFAQLEELSDLFSIELIKNTYSVQPLIEIPGVEYLYNDFIKRCIKTNIDITNKKQVKTVWKEQIEDIKQQITKDLQRIVETETTFNDRRNRLLDHLLARFAFDYNNIRFDFEAEGDEAKKLIRHKIIILENMIKLSKERAKAQVYLFSDQDEESNISGLEYRINTYLKLSGTSNTFPFEFYEKGIGIKPYNQFTANNEDLDIIVPETFPDIAAQQIFLYGSEPENYLTQQNEAQNYVVKIKNAEGNVFGYFRNTFNTLEDAETVIKNISFDIYNLSQQSEAIHIIERNLYRPHLEMKYFTFTINNPDFTPAFINDGYLSFYERENKVKKVLELAREKSNYIYAVSSNQYKIVLVDENRKELLTCHKFLNSEKEVFKEIDFYVDFFNRFYDGTYNANDYIRYYTKHNDLFNLDSNPYSFILTVLIPSWPVKFQNESFRTHLENKIREEIPAHIYPDIKWVGIEKLMRVTYLCREYRHLVQKSRPDFEQLSEISDELFAFFVK